jgi:hypothetical protein
MKRIILIGAFALLTACGGSGKDGSTGTGGNDASSADSVASNSDSTDSTVEGSDDTITVTDFSDMPPKCIDLLASFLKKIEPTVSDIDWEKATLADFEAFNTQFEADSASFDAETAAEGCDKYDLDTSDEKQFEQMTALAAAEAPGTVGFISFLSLLASSASGSNEPIPADCAGTIAAIEPFLAKGTMKELTMAELTRVGSLMTAVNTNCTPEETTAFYGRDDVTAFVGG